MRYDLWICRLGALAVGMTAGGLHVIRHLGRPFAPSEPHADAAALAIVAGVACWLVVSLEIAKQRDKVRARLAPGLASSAIAGVALAVASSTSGWPITTSDAGIIFVIGLLGSSGVLMVPGSLRDNPWSRSKLERD